MVTNRQYPQIPMVTVVTSSIHSTTAAACMGNYPPPPPPPAQMATSQLPATCGCFFLDMSVVKTATTGSFTCLSTRARVVDNALCKMKSEAVSESQGSPQIKGRLQLQGLGCMPRSILQNDPGSSNYSKGYGLVAIPLRGIICFRVG